MAPILDGTASDYGAYETPRIYGAQWGYWSALVVAVLLAVAA